MSSGRGSHGSSERITTPFRLDASKRIVAGFACA
jgi:hypothetical protein